MTTTPTTTTPGLTRPPQETTVAEKERCSRCRYWQSVYPRSAGAPGLDASRAGMPRKVQDDDLGRCHRYPPARPHSAQRFEPLKEWLFPVTAAADWCGEYRG